MKHLFTGVNSCFLFVFCVDFVQLQSSWLPGSVWQRGGRHFQVSLTTKVMTFFFNRNNITITGIITALCKDAIVEFSVNFFNVVHKQACRGLK